MNGKNIYIAGSRSPSVHIQDHSKVKFDIIKKKKKNDNMVIVGTLEEVKIHDQKENTNEK